MALGAQKPLRKSGTKTLGSDGVATLSRLGNMNGDPESMTVSADSQ